MIAKLILAFYLIFIAPTIAIIMVGLAYGGAMEFYKAFIVKEQK